MTLADFPLSYFGGAPSIVAYCLKLENKPAILGHKHEIAATRAEPSKPTQDEPEDEAAMNAAMIERDLRPSTSRELARAIDYAADSVASENILKVAPWTNRFGGWGA